MAPPECADAKPVAVRRSQRSLVARRGRRARGRAFPRSRLGIGAARLSALARACATRRRAAFSGWARRPRGPRLAQHAGIRRGDVRLLVGGCRRRSRECEAASMGARVRARRLGVARSVRGWRLAGDDRPPREGQGELAHVVRLGGAVYEPLVAGSAPPTLAACARDDPAWLFYTSGTTGRPKGVEITQAISSR